jgi:CRISPR-associated protein Cas1
MQIWMKAWLDDDARLLMAKILLLERIALVSQHGKEF